MVGDKVIVVSAGFKRFFSPSWLLQQKTMITMENRTSLQANYLFCYVETTTIPSDRSGIFVLCFRKARQRTVNRTGSKMKCVELCNRELTVALNSFQHLYFDGSL